MNVKNIVTIGALIVGSYWTGKLSGASEGAKAALKKYGDIIPDDELTVMLIDKAKYKLSTTVKKKKSNKGS